MRRSRLNSGRISAVLIGFAAWLTISCLAFTVIGCAQESSPTARPAANDLAFRCIVADSAGHPLSGIWVDLKSAAPPVDQIQSFTEADGSYTFEGLRAGDYLLIVAGGILSPPRHVRVNTGPSVALTLRLPITLPGSNGHGASVVSVQQLNIPPKVLETSQKAFRAWLHSDFDQGRLLALQTLQMRPDYGPALELLGMIDFVEKHPAEAINELLQALRQDPSSPRSYLVLASAYNELRQNANALHALSLLNKLTPENWQVHYETGRAYLGQGRYDAAMLEFDHAQSVSETDNSIVHLGKAHAMLGLADYAGAHDELDAALRGSPDGPFAAESRELALVVNAHLKKEPATNPGTIARGPKVEH